MSKTTYHRLVACLYPEPLQVVFEHAQNFPAIGTESKQSLPQVTDGMENSDIFIVNESNKIRILTTTVMMIGSHYWHGNWADYKRFSKNLYK